MKGVQIFTHSLRQVTGNMPAAIRVSGLLYVVQFVVGVLMAPAATDQESLQLAMEQGQVSFGAILLSGLVTVLSGVWIAVAWHRYVLREEGAGFLPVFLGGRFLGYFGKTLLIFLILLPIAAVLGVVATFLLIPFAQFGSPLGILMVTGALVYLPLVVIGLRLSTILPGVALMPGQPLTAGWNATHGETANFVVLALLTLGMTLVVSVPSAFVFAPQSVPAILWNFAAGWFVTMVGVSILTTLYGHYIEKRALL